MNTLNELDSTQSSEIDDDSFIASTDEDLIVSGSKSAIVDSFDVPTQIRDDSLSAPENDDDSFIASTDQNLIVSGSKGTIVDSFEILAQIRDDSQSEPESADDHDESVIVFSKPRKIRNIIESDSDEDIISSDKENGQKAQMGCYEEDSKNQSNSFHSIIEGTSTEERLDISDESANMSPVSALDGRKSYRMSMNIENAASSTFIGDIKEEYNTPRSVRPHLDSNSDSEIEIISDSDPEQEVMVKSPINAVNLKQPTLSFYTAQQHIPYEEKVQQIEVSNPQYQEQKNKVQKLQSDLVKTNNLIRTLNLKALPDNGKLLKAKYESIIQQLKTDEETLSKMIVKENLQQQPNKTLQPQTWQQLQAIASEVQPRTFGKQALATHNLQKALTMDRLQDLHGSIKTCPTEDTFETDPKGLLVELMPHQKSALAWLLWRENQKPSAGILADDMGLGKTLTMISLVLKSAQLNPDEDDDENREETEESGKRFKYKGGTLIVCPASLLGQWEGEIKSKVRRGLLSVEIHHGPNRELKSKKRLSRFDVVVTTYAIAMNEMERNTALFNIKWNRIVLDEAHQIRNHKAKTSLAVCGLSAKSRWALTGTPIHNKELDIYALLKFLRVTPFDDLAVFKRWVSDKNAGGQQRLNTVISSLLLRRTKAQLQLKGSLQCLPERQWQIVDVVLSKQETDVYQKILIFSRTLFSQFLHQRAEKNQDNMNERPTFARADDPNGEYYKMHQKLVKMNKVKEVKQHDILLLLLRLRQICCHASLITAMLQDGELDDNAEEYDSDLSTLNLLDQLNKLNLDDEEEAPINPAEGLAEPEVGFSEACRSVLNPSNPVFNKNTRSSKISKVIKMVQEKVLSTDDKCIIVSQWTSLLKLLGSYFTEENIKYDQLDGTVAVQKRAALVDNFNNPKYNTKILLLSLTAGGVGLNLVGANHLFLLDLHWNPQLEMQAQDRIFRVGQKKPVFIYKFMSVDTIEVRIKALQDHKKNIADALLTGAKMLPTKLSLDELKMLFSL